MADTVPSELPRPSLRERKRLAAMHRIQSVALELFERDGFDEVTIERIAQDAEVSPSSVYRWFGTKEMLVIWDEFDPMSLAAFEERVHTAPALEALREVVRLVIGAAMDSDTDRIHRRLRLAFANPSIEAASVLQAHEMAGLIAAILARGEGADVADLDVQVTAHAFVGAMLGAFRHYEASDFATPLEDVIESPLQVLRYRDALG